MQSREAGRQHVGCFVVLAIVGGVVAALANGRPGVGTWTKVGIGVLSGLAGIAALVAFCLVICGIDFVIRRIRRRGDP